MGHTGVVCYVGAGEGESCRGGVAYVEAGVNGSCRGGLSGSCRGGVDYGGVGCIIQGWSGL